MVLGAQIRSSANSIAMDDKEMSQYKLVKHGVPQDSALEPVMLNLYDKNFLNFISSNNCIVDDDEGHSAKLFEGYS